ncbi:MAG: HlyD family efflux transporter periplasmic adaptor subunit [Planctomycetaceae bacterium]|jgi:multidrug efflux pump subunit AcrA (membrane-fusion protein)|nr:HlyD family efflux transporter periplasmic adaptor subunit [Phycisphaerales bacterium]MCE2653105.1 HlyD family efflux transporter periplasmic adaptor subunit [Planctomycetaceae bacterium]
MTTPVRDPAPSFPADAPPPSPRQADAGSSGGRPLLAAVLRALIGGGVLVAGIAIAGWLVATRAEPEKAPRQMDVATVSVIPATPMPVRRPIIGFGTARSMNTATVSAQVTGRVLERPPGVEPGARVTAGQLLVRLDDSEYRNRVTSAEQLAAALSAQLEQIDIDRVALTERMKFVNEELRAVQAELDRSRKAAEVNAASQADLDRLSATVARAGAAASALRQQVGQLDPTAARLRAELASQRSAKAIAEEDLARTRVLAPISGVLQSVDVDEGDFARPGTLVARVVDPSVIEIPVRIAASVADQVTVGAVATLSINSASATALAPDADAARGGGAAITCTVTRIAPEADPATRSVTVFLEHRCTGERPDVLPGQFVTAQLASAQERPVILVPRRAVVDDAITIAEPTGEDGHRLAKRRVGVLFAIEGRRPDLDPAEMQWLALDPAVPGLRREDLVVVSGTALLSPGAFVKPVPAAASGGKP